MRKQSFLITILSDKKDLKQLIEDSTVDYLEDGEALIDLCVWNVVEED